MKITIFTADFAQVDERGKLNAIGLGWTTVPTPLPGHSIAVVFEVDWAEANEHQAFLIELVDADGNILATNTAGAIIAVPADSQSEAAPLVRLEGTFEVGRPAGLVKGTPLTNIIAVNLPAGMPLSPGRYTYRVSVGDVFSNHSFSVVQAW